MSYYAICDESSGEAVSFASVLPDTMRAGLVVVEVDGPPDGRTWNASKRAYGPRPVVERPQSRLERARALWPADDSSVPAWARALAAALGVKD